MSIKTKLSTVVSKQLPEFVREDHPTFVAFIEAYYEYMATQQPRTLETVRDIDDSLDSFVINFKNELDINGRYFSDVPITERYFLKNIKQLYTSKGSLASYNLLFRILFNKDVELRYPSASMLRVSDGKWKQDVSVFARTSAGDINDIVGNHVSVVKTVGNSVKTIKLFINKVKFIRTGVYEIFFNNNYTGTLDPGSSITFGSYVGDILKTITGYNIYQAGQNFKLGQLLNVNVIVGSEQLQCIAKIITVNLDGGIKTIEIVKFNGGYDDESFYFITQPEKVIVHNEATLRVDSGAPGTNELFTLPSSTSTLGNIDYGFISKPDYWGDYSDTTYTGEIIQSFYTEKTAALDTTSKYDAIIVFNLGIVVKYAGYYTTNDGFVSDEIYIQDSKYYQAFSYVIKVDEQLNSYKALVKSYLHPAGTSLFAEYVLNNSFNLTLQNQSIISFGRIKLATAATVLEYLYKSMQFHTPGDTATISEIVSKEFITQFEDSFSTPTDVLKIPVMKYAETIDTPTDETSIAVLLNKTESITANDSNFRIPYVQPVDSITLTETQWKYSGVFKALESFVISESIHDIVMGFHLADAPTITDVLSLPNTNFVEEINITDAFGINKEVVGISDSFSMSTASASNSIIKNPYVEAGYVVTSDNYVDVPINF